MATVTSTVPAFLDALKTALEARAAIPGNPLAPIGERPAVTIATAPSGDADPLEAVELIGARETQEWGAIGHRRRNEEYTVGAVVFIVRRGAGEARAKEARDRAYAILAELEDTLRTDPGVSGTVRQSQITEIVLDQDFNDNGRWAALGITIEVKAELRS
jgi:hypothetical protein